MSCPSATLTVWTSAWLHGSAAADDVLDALQSWTTTQLFAAGDPAAADATALPDVASAPATAAELLAALRRTGAGPAALILPVPGDVRGTGGKGPFCDAAVAAGEAVVFPDAALGVAPEHAGGHGEDSVIRWTVFTLPSTPVIEHTPLAEAEHELAGAMRAAATALVELDVARHRPNVRGEIDELVNGGPSLPWPHAMPPRAVRVLRRAAEVDAILQVASGDAPGGALSASAASKRARVLAPLTHAVRFARTAAVNEAVRVFAETAQTQ